MKRASLDAVLSDLDNQGPSFRSHRSPELLGVSLEDDLWNLFKELRFFTPSDHDSFCRRLHDQIAKHLGVTIQPMYCATAAVLNEKRFAKYCDILTLEPLCVGYDVWLDFGKWMTLAVDRSSMRFFAENRELLSPFLAGKRQPEIPEKVIALLGVAVE